MTWLPIVALYLSVGLAVAKWFGGTNISWWTVPFPLYMVYIQYLFMMTELYLKQPKERHNV